MSKEEIITEIKTIIDNYGSFTTADVMADSSPCVASFKGATQLAESFYKDKIEAVSYETQNDNEIGTAHLAYEELNEDVLADILKLAKDWETQNQE